MRSYTTVGVQHHSAGVYGINLTKSVSFVDFKGLSIIGEGGASLVTIFCSSSGAGLEFVNVLSAQCKPHGMWIGKKCEEV